MVLDQDRGVKLGLVDLSQQSPTVDFDQKASDFSKALYCPRALPAHFAFLNRFQFFEMLALPKKILKGSAEDRANHNVKRAIATCMVFTSATVGTQTS